MSSLWIYAMLGNYMEVEKLLKQGLHVDSTNEMGSTAIIEAARQAELKVVKLLLTYNARLDVRSLEGDTALIVAMQYINLAKEKIARMKIIRLLKEHGASLDITHPIDKKMLVDFKNNVSAEEFKDCFAEFCKTPNEVKTASWSSSFVKQFPFLQSWFTFALPPTTQELQTMRANNSGHHVHGNKQIKMD